MSIDIEIKQKGFSKKTIPLETIIGTKLSYGAFDGDHLEKGKLGNFDFIAYDPKHIGRGICVEWTPQEKRKISIRVPQPTATEELRDLYDMVERIMTHWKASLTVDGEKTKLSDFLANYSNTVDFNDRIIKKFSDDVLSGEYDTLTLYSAMFPLHISKEEAAVFSGDTYAYRLWLHEKQSVDAKYVGADFFMNDDGGIYAVYKFTKNTVQIFPKKPSVPFGLTDPRTGKALECNDWEIFFFNNENEEKPHASMKYDEFLARIEKLGAKKHTAELFIVPILTEDEYTALISE